MSFPASYVNGNTIANKLVDNIAIDFNTSTNGSFKLAIFGNTPGSGNRNATETYGTTAPWTSANEVSSANYAPVDLNSVNITISTGKWVWGTVADAVTWSNVTFNAEGGLVYWNATGRVICALNFNNTVHQVVDGLFTVTWDTNNKIFYATY
jgi:hypothetical protein